MRRSNESFYVTEVSGEVRRFRSANNTRIFAADPFDRKSQRFAIADSEGF